MRNTTCDRCGLAEPINGLVFRNGFGVDLCDPCETAFLIWCRPVRPT